MKKIYIAPDLSLVKVESTNIIATSVYNTKGNGIQLSRESDFGDEEW